MDKNLLDIQLKKYLEGYSLLQKAVDGINPEIAKQRPIDGKWSTLECICHLTDFELVFAERMKLIIALKKPLFFGYDPTEFLQNLAYQTRDIFIELNVFQASRQQMLSIFHHLPLELFDKKGVHSERGLMSLFDVLKMNNWHVDHHLYYIDEKRKALRLSLVGFEKV